MPPCWQSAWRHSWPPLHQPAPPVDADLINRIADATFNHSEIAGTEEYLADRIGGRMTNSPGMRAAERWTEERFRAWGLKNVRADGFDFGRGWWIESSELRMVSPRPLGVRSIPIAWTPGTQGPVKAAILVAPMHSEKDFSEWKGKVQGKFVLVTWPGAPKDETEPAFKRLQDADFAKGDHFVEPEVDLDRYRKFIEFTTFKRKVDGFLAGEGAIAWAQMSRSEGRLVHGEGYSYKVGETPRLPAFEIAAEDYRRLARLAKVGPVELEFDSRIHYEDADHNAYNILAEIPGTDARAGYVMAGAHLDSWVAGDGAADNGAGSAVVMEAARILASLGVKPRRTIRFVLWAGEEQGLLGSAAYIEKYLAHRGHSPNPELVALGPYFELDAFPVEPLPGFGEMAGYFNLDNGSGKVRGIYAEGNFAAAPILKQWLAPLASVGAATVVAEPTGGTDHVLMSRIGLPAFEFIQDPLDYGSRVHHTDLDVYDHLRMEDLRQAAFVMAVVLMNAANSEAPLPRNVLPTRPAARDPFKYPDPEEK